MSNKFKIAVGDPGSQRLKGVIVDCGIGLTS
jgi:hypothetical protein